MTQMTYTRLLNATLEKYETSGTEEAYKFISRHAVDIEENHAQIYNFRYSLAAASGYEQEALAIMKKAILDNGHWYSYEYLMEDEDLDPLRKFIDFQHMIELCKKREEEAKQAAKPELEVMRSVDSKGKQSLLVALHGNQENINRTKENWHTVTSKDYVLGIPQSSRIEFSGGYSWDDTTKGVSEIQDHIEQMNKDFNTDEPPLILGGFSAGARVVLHTMLEDNISVKGFIFVGPWLPEIDELAGDLALLAERGIKGYVICGDQDEDCLESTTHFVELLEEKQVPHTYQLVSGLDHDYPEDFEKMLESAIDYITK
jgi:predicted esterase